MDYNQIVSFWFCLAHTKKAYSEHTPLSLAPSTIQQPTKGPYTNTIHRHNTPWTFLL